MAEEETVIAFIAAVVALGGNSAWLWSSHAGGTCGRPRPLVVRLMLLTPVIAAVILGVLLNAFGDEWVRGSVPYILMYIAIGLAWVPVAAGFSGWLGISLRDDVGERRTPGAAVIHLAVYLGLTLCYAGGNFGDGPGWWVVLFSALLSTLGFYAVWLLLQITSNLAEHVTVDRDVNTALRAAGVLLGASLILGRAVAGDWVSAAATVDEFLPIAVWALGLVAIEAVVARVLGGFSTNAPSIIGLVPAAGYVTLALFICSMQGPWW